MKRLLVFGTFALLALAACDRKSGDATLDTAPEGWWTFDEGSGDTAADASGHGNGAMVRDGGWDNGKIDGALSMDGDNRGIVIVPMSPGLRATAEAITVMGWVRRENDQNAALVSHGYPDLFLGFHGLQFKWEIETVRNKRAACYADPKNVATPGQWFHLAGTYDGSTARLYVDGREICSKHLWFGGAIKMPDRPFTISGYFNAQGGIVDEVYGLVDDVRLYARALDAQEIDTIYQAAR